MSNLSESEIYNAADSARGILNLGRALASTVETSHIPTPNRENAIRAYTKALGQTIKYLKATRHDPAARDEEVEYTLSELWNEAGIAVRQMDSELADRCFIKGQGWLDPGIWSDPRYRAQGITIHDMRAALLEFNKSQGQVRNGSGKPSGTFSKVTNFVGVEKNRKLLSWLGTALAAVVVGLWTLFTFIVDHGEPKGAARLRGAATQANSSSAIGGSTIINGPVTINSPHGVRPIDCSKLKGYPRGRWSLKAVRVHDGRPNTSFVDGFWLDSDTAGTWYQGLGHELPDGSYPKNPQAPLFASQRPNPGTTFNLTFQGKAKERMTTAELAVATQLDLKFQSTEVITVSPDGCSMLGRSEQQESSGGITADAQYCWDNAPLSTCPAIREGWRPPIVAQTSR